MKEVTKMENKDTIYFTREQLERFLDNQTPKKRALFESMHKDDDKDHISLIETVQSRMFNCPDDIIDICVDYEIEMEELEDKKNGIVRTHIGDKIFTDEQRAIFTRELSEEEIDKRISKLHFSDSLKHIFNRKVTF